jgi:hypothetical protein
LSGLRTGGAPWRCIRHRGHVFDSGETSESQSGVEHFTSSVAI